MKVYYVCNDFSLELSDYTKKPEGYTWESTFVGEFGYDKHGDLGFFIPTQTQEE